MQTLFYLQRKPFSRFSPRYGDTGIGISEAAQARLFRAFSQADGSTTREYGGTGLGLAISKRLVDLMDGQIDLESEQGSGTSIRFELPLPAASSEPFLSSASRDALRGMHMLIVDDNRTNRNVLTRQLNNWEISTTSASSAIEALDILQRSTSGQAQRFDAIILDMHMPEMDGLALANEIQDDEHISQIPMIMLTSLSSPVSRDELHKAGILVCLQKPVREAHLYNSLLKHTLRTNHRVTPKQPSASPKQAQQFNLHILLAEDNLVNQRVAQLQLKKIGCTLDIVPNGAEAIEAFKKNRYDLILMDCQMPIIEGYEATRQIRQIESTRNEYPGIYIIAITAHAMEGDRQRCLDAGMNDYVSKPLLAHSISDAFRRYLETQRD